jgi:hypothetical protein
MCDYSLHGLPSRLAVQGEELVAHRFCTGAIGLASPAELRRFIGSARDRKRHWWSLISAETLPQVASEATAVCVPPGTRLRLSDISVTLQSELGVGPIETVIFTQTDAASGTYHDAVQFTNGRRILLQVLKDGQRVRVLSLVSGDAGNSDFVNKWTDSERLVSRLPLFATSEVKQSVYLRRRAARPLAE